MMFTGWNVHTAAVTSNDDIRWIRAIETFIGTVRMKIFFEKIFIINNSYQTFVEDSFFLI